MEYVYQRVYKALVRHKVNNVFLYSGGAIMSLIDTFHPKNNTANIKYYVNSNESCGTASAVGYAKASGNTGVCITTSGPGLTNCVSNILDAYTDSVPLVVISGQVPLSVMGTCAFQEAPSTEITRSITKWNCLVDNPQHIDEIMENAFFIANDRKKGPVHIDIPKCVLNTKIVSQPLIQTKEKIFSHSIRGSVSDLVSAIQMAERPVLYVGKGVLHAKKELSDFVRKSNIPITTTLHALGAFDEYNSLSLHMLGMHGSYYANQAIQNADLILCIGARFDDRCTGKVSEFARSAKNIFHVNIESSEFHKTIKQSVNIECDSKILLPLLTSLVRFKHYESWHSQINFWKEDKPFTFKFKSNKLMSQHILTEMNHHLPKSKQTIFVTGVGNHQMYVAQFIKFRENMQMVTSGSLGNMESGLPNAIGAKIACPDSLVICVVGDGSFHMSMSDLVTILKYKIPLKIVVMNNGTQDMVRCWENLFFDGRVTATTEVSPNYEALSFAFGISYMRLSGECVTDTHAILKEFIEKKEAVLLECVVEPDYCFPLVKPGHALDEMLLEVVSDERFESKSAPN